MKSTQRLIPAIAATLGLAAAVSLPRAGGELPQGQKWQALEANLEVPPAVSAILARVCRNCHSNETKWPWYGRVAPLKWVLERDVARARQAMNFSIWAAGPGRNPAVAASTLAAACADIRSDRMPLAPYRLMHPESRLSPADKRAFCDWANHSSNELLSRHMHAEP